MRKGGYYVNNTLLGEVDKETSWRVNKLIVEEDKVTRGRVNKETSGRVNKLIAKKDKVTGEQEVSTYNIWGEKGLKKARD